MTISHTPRFETDFNETQAAYFQEFIACVDGVDFYRGEPFPGTGVRHYFLSGHPNDYSDNGPDLPRKSGWLCDEKTLADPDHYKLTEAAVEYIRAVILLES